jgi:uncharacterized protein YndB with AHSA1/START domain
MAAEENSAAADSSDRTLVITRTFDAPRAMVFKAWTEPEQLMKWWGPKGFSTPSCEIDLRPGGSYRIRMRSPEGREFWWRGTYREVLAPERLVWTFTYEDSAGTPLSPEILLTVLFEDEGSQTRLTLRHAVGNEEIERNARQGWNESLERLASCLAHA